LTGETSIKGVAMNGDEFNAWNKQII